MSQQPTSLIPTSVRLEPKLKARLEKLGKNKRRTVHWLMKEAIRRYVALEEESEKLRKETLNRWGEADLGETVSNEAMKAWLGSWGTKHKTKNPTSGRSK